MLAKDAVIVPERTGQGGLSGTKYGDGRDSEKSCEMHRAGIIGEQQIALFQFFDHFADRSFPDEISASG